MRSEHENAFTESQLVLITQKIARPASDVFEILAGQSITTGEIPSDCPLCVFSAADAIALGNTTRQDTSLDHSLLGAPETVLRRKNVIRDHIATHLETIALLSLPPRDDDDGRESSLSLTQNRRPDTDRDDFRGHHTLSG